MAFLASESLKKQELTCFLGSKHSFKSGHSWSGRQNSVEKDNLPCPSHTKIVQILIKCTLEKSLYYREGQCLFDFEHHCAWRVLFLNVKGENLWHWFLILSRVSGQAISLIDFWGNSLKFSVAGKAWKKRCAYIKGSLVFLQGEWTFFFTILTGLRFLSGCFPVRVTPSERKPFDLQPFEVDSYWKRRRIFLT